MIIRNRFIKTLITIGVATMLMIPFVATDKAALSAVATTKNLDPGSTWFVHETTNLTSLTIPESASIRAPEGYRVTLTVDGVETPIKPGTYKGKIVLTVTKTA